MLPIDNNKGFILNGERLRIKGVCCHQNHGGLGNAVPKEVMRYRIKKLKEMGANGYRGAHYPLSEEFLTICDQEGMLVMLETRLLSSARPDMDELTKMVKLGRSHPSVIMYSIGNEEASSQATDQGARIASTMMDHIKRLDPYRPVTMALLMLDMKTNEVELILNGKSLGIKEMPKDDYLVWEKIVSEKGVMEAVGYKDGSVVMRTVNKTCDEESSEIVVTEDYRENIWYMES